MADMIMHREFYSGNVKDRDHMGNLYVIENVIFV
jgi:hypothetical protein